MFSLIPDLFRSHTTLVTKRKVKFIRFSISVMALCLSCNQEVTNRQEALLCDGCDRWVHRKCGTGVSRQEYRDAVKRGRDIEWHCKDCSFVVPGQPLHQSTPNYVPGKELEH